MSTMLDVSDVQPPTYDDTVNESRVQLSCGETPTLFLDRTIIFANTDPPRPLYEVSNNVCEARFLVYGVQKIAYRVTSSANGDKIRTRLDHIYDFSLDSLALGEVVSIEGKMSSKRTVKETSMEPGISSWRVKDHFKVGEGAVHQLKHADEVHWKNMKGEVIAVETVAKRDKQKSLIGFPKLEIKIAMEDKELDLLVTCWMARVWRQSAGEVKEPMTWQDFKTISKIALNNNRWGFW
ncbi:hypothetical protein CkaCkLH20_00622 [Colletotrichum karsti]|uniref:Uncharacterized protein n=1 Tax=Colletotrichum karsti TaxID=1095194 RepID=A0A9P6LQB7_9PEZI|nr:uncharacterized protein CkaCkLH20_00622 [Colletotrichum karsti]KAF9881476.1 hypothetical protein CkaCkLH20_00622 [Colletotrichum karsti]